MLDRKADYVGKVYAIGALTTPHGPPPASACLEFSIDGGNTVLYFDLIDSKSQTVVAVVTAAFVSQHRLKIWEKTDQRGYVEAVQLEAKAGRKKSKRAKNT